MMKNRSDRRSENLKNETDQLGRVTDKVGARECLIEARSDDFMNILDVN